MNSSYVCPYCGKEIHKEDVLFWRTTKTQYTDKLRGKFLRRHGVEEKGNKFRRLYYKPRWDDEGNPENICREDENGFPTALEDYPEKGLEPESLDSRPFSSGSGFNDSFDDSFDDFDDTDEDDDESSEQEKIIIPNRACPFCHCDLPAQFGVLPAYHVAMFGGRGAGKTSYLVSLFQQINNQLRKNDLGSLELADESKEFINPKIKYYESTNTMEPTAADDGLLPIVCHYSCRNNEAFIIFYDIAGEGTMKSEYMANHKGIARCESLMLMIDPNMFEQGTYYAEWHANHPTESDESNDSDENGDCCRDTVDTFLSVAGNYCSEYGDNIKNIICVITKMDMLLEAESSFFSTGEIELLSDTEEKHLHDVNLSTLVSVQKELNEFISKRFHIKIIEKIKSTLGNDKRVVLLGVSTSTIEKGKNGRRYSFTPNSSSIKSKHRIAEPFFVLLMYYGLVNAKKPDGTIVQYDPLANEQSIISQVKEEPIKRKGFFAKLFGR